MPIQIRTPVARLVYGHPLRQIQKKDNKGNVQFKKDGTPRMVVNFGLAIPKAAFIAEVWPHMAAEAATIFPQGTPPHFAWKYKDCDHVDRNGKPYREREGYADCFVLNVSTEAAIPPVYRFDKPTGQYVQLTEKDIKTGDYVVGALNLKAQKPDDATNNPSLYINPGALELVGVGTEIVTGGVDPMAAFGGQSYALPAGVTLPGAAPAAPSHGVGMPGTGGPTAAPGYAPQPQPAAAPQMPGTTPYPMPAAGATPAPQMGSPAMPATGMPGAPALPGAPAAVYPSNFVANAAGMPYPTPGQPQ